MTTAVIIPVRNRPALVREAIESLQTQTRPIDEVIVVDDASTDDTPAVVEAIGREDARVRLIRLSQNQGASHARNVGVAATNADYVGFLDSDDTWMPQKHELQLERLAQAPEAVACFTGIRYVLPGHVKDEPLPAKVAPDALRRMNYLGSTSTALIRKSTFLQAGGFDEALPSCQDWDLWLRLEAKGAFALVRQPLVLYGHTDEARISRNSTNVLAGHQVVFERALRDVPAAKQRKLRAYHQARLAQIQLWEFENPKAALGPALRSLTIRPTRFGFRLIFWALKDIAGKPPRMAWAFG